MIPILMYHQVAEIPRNQDPLGLAVPPGRFEEQMRYLERNGYTCLTLPEAVNSFKKEGRTPSKSFVITFDDGYQDIYTTVCPILERYTFAATVFLVAGRVGTSSNWMSQKGTLSGKLLSWSDARALTQRGILFGSHTFSHPRLSLLDDQSALEELRSSKMLIQDRLELPVDFFSYPYSNTDARTEHLVQTAGYTAACAGDSGAWSIFHLWRIPCLRDDTPRRFVLKVSGWYEKKIMLRESIPGRMLIQGVHKVRRRQTPNHPHSQGLINQEHETESER